MMSAIENPTPGRDMHADPQAPWGRQRLGELLEQLVSRLGDPLFSWNRGICSLFLLDAG
jgi:hypothetical protein